MLLDFLLICLFFQSSPLQINQSVFHFQVWKSVLRFLLKHSLGFSTAFVPDAFHNKRPGSTFLQCISLANGSVCWNTIIANLF